MNPFLGGYHYTIDRELAPEWIRKTDSTIQRQKVSILKETDSLLVVSPSKWLKKEAESSKAFSDTHVRHIPNGVDTRIFQPYDRLLARSLFGLDAHTPILLTAAETLSSYRKGTDLLQNALRLSPLSPDWSVVTAGMGSIDAKPYHFRNIGPLGDERLMALLLSAADLVVVPTRQDNLPNVIIESLACGTPVVSNPVGGVSEIITTGFNGVLSEETAPDALAAALTKAAETSFQKGSIRADAIKRFDHQVMAEAYFALYKGIHSA